jgi:hypothetical protein
VLGLPLAEEQHGDTEPHWGCELGDVHFAIHHAADYPDDPASGRCPPGTCRRPRTARLLSTAATASPGKATRDDRTWPVSWVGVAGFSTGGLFVPKPSRRARRQLRCMSDLRATVHRCPPMSVAPRQNSRAARPPARRLFRRISGSTRVRGRPHESAAVVSAALARSESAACPNANPARSRVSPGSPPRTAYCLST